TLRVCGTKCRDCDGVVTNGADQAHAYAEPATPETPTLSLHDALPISFVTGLYALGNITGYYATPGLNPQAASGPGYTLLGSPTVDRKSTRLNSSHVKISYAVFCLKKKTRYVHTRANPPNGLARPARVA